MNVVFIAKDQKQQLQLPKQQLSLPRQQSLLQKSQQQQVKKPESSQPMQEPVYAVYVDTKEKLIAEARVWNSCQELGIDIECENNLHHYGAYISIIQISSKDRNWVVDIIRLGQIQPLIDVFRNRGIVKIFHDVSFDFRILKRQFDCIPQNVFDTQLAAILLGKPDLGLGSLLHEYFDVKKESKFQMADWTKRPLTPEMINYAIRDTNHLIGLKEVLKKELIAQGRWPWFEEETALIKDRAFDYKEGDFFGIKGISKLSNSERAILKKLCDIRELLAKKVNRPVHFIISTGRMVDIAKAPPSLTEWANMKGVHPVVRSKARAIYEEVQAARKMELKMPKSGEKKHYSQKQKDEFERYNLIRDRISERLGLQKHVVLSKEQIKDIVLTGKFDSLRTWQKPIVMHELKK